MVPPGKGDYIGIPISAAGKRTADAWDQAKDEAAGNQCRAYGAPGLMNLPTHLHITWQDDNTLRVDTDYGTQTRILRFGRRQCHAAGIAQTQLARQLGRGVGLTARGSRRTAVGTLSPDRDDRPVARLPAQERRPYGDNASLLEYVDLFREPERRGAHRVDRGRGRPGESRNALYHLLAVQETGGWIRMAADAVFGRVVTVARVEDEIWRQPCGEGLAQPSWSSRQRAR